MSLTLSTDELLSSISLQTIAISGLAALLLVHLIPWLVDRYNLRAYPGPFIAQFSDIWMGWVALRGRRSVLVHELHHKYGPFVRIAPNHLSISVPEALSVVYGHGTGTLKSDFYDSFVTIQPSLVSSRDRAEHTRKRKIVSHIFSSKSVVDFEPELRNFVEILLGQWERMYQDALKGLSGGQGENEWNGGDGRLWFNCLPWFNYLAFDFIGDLAFGKPFGMLSAGKDTAMAVKDVDSAMKSLDGGDTSSMETVEIPAVKILNGRAAYGAPIGVLPRYWRPIVGKLPWYSRGSEDVGTMAGMAVMSVAKRLAVPSNRNDLLNKLSGAKDEHGNSMGREEVTAEALGLLVAGSDTTSHSIAAIVYYITRDPRIQKKLQEELDAHISDTGPVSSDSVKHLPYLLACINEGLRLFSTVPIGLPRVVPEGGLAFMGHFFPEGTILSVPSYTIHRDPAVWGDDPEVYRPERWLEADKDRSVLMHKAFTPFSIGPRACIGRNIAMLEMEIAIASVMHEWDFVLEEEDQGLLFKEGFIRRPLGVRVGVKRRNII
ncbi:cytochrome P450 monooxygenase [Dendrothele bispora CBS 962.96]|uniref:Cytochrome P450 monooxygenase n=1 Tax=Dendrothele bispora (strain CBS 962.96) TaxID=1314807 RepID=A0A4S8MFW1_DENBC|nr:cytochrome P450 monooxygenase [Dendrothele bispora CBS 962.96]